jgi:hypothetical protein
VYAGAAREAVFSVPAVIRRVNADFIPLALRAPLVNGVQAVGDEDEKWLYERIGRAKLAPQGICVLDSSGQVLCWVQMFDSNADVLAFLDHARKRFQDNADAKPPAVTQRYMKFPSMKLEDFQDKTRPPAAREGHALGKHCSARNAKGVVPPGSLVARLVGRMLDERGQLLADVINQEHYAEDRFIVLPPVQEAVAGVLARAGTERVRLPDAFARLCATPAHLGHIDVRPLFSVGPFQNKGEWKKCQFWAARVEVGKDSAVWRIEGESEVASDLEINGRGVHQVQLTWEGFLTMNGTRMSQLLLSARGREKLEYGNDDNRRIKVKEDEVTCLPAGRPVDVNGGVRYGIIGTPASADEVDDRAAAPAADTAPEIPDEARKPLVEALGETFIVFRDRVQEELKLSGEQKAKLLQTFPEHVQETMKVFEKIKDLKPPEREKVMHEHRQKSAEKLSALLGKLLDARQQERFGQLQLQQAGVFVLLGEHEAARRVKVTDEQRKQFMEVMQDLHKKIHALAREVEAGGNPAELRPRMMKIRKEHEGRIEALLSDAQKKRWQELLGKPLDLDD